MIQAQRIKFKQVAKIRDAAAGFADRNGRVGSTRDLTQRAHVIHENRILDPAGIVVLQCMGDLDRTRTVPQRVHFGHDIHPRSDGLPDAGEGLQGTLEIRGRDVMATRFFRGVIEGPYLHAIDAHLKQRMRQIIGAVQEGVEILVRPFIDTEAEISCTLAGAVPDIAIAGAGVVDADFFTNGAAEQLVQRQSRRLTPDIPEGDVDGRTSALLGAGAAETDIADQFSVVTFDQARILPKQHGGNRLVDMRFGRPRPEEGLAQSDQAGIGADMDPEKIRELLDADRLDRIDFHQNSILHGYK